MPNCDRCGKDTTCTIMSYFNTDILCMECADKERRHPKYMEAKQIETDHVKRGDWNFKGIGKPADL